MPRVNGIMQPLPNTYGQPGRPIESAKYNTQLDDFVADANAARPVTAGGTGAVSAADARTNLGLGSVNNTADADKPVSTATQTAINAAVALLRGTVPAAYNTLKTLYDLLIEHTSRTNNPHSTTALQVGLGNVANKPEGEMANAGPLRNTMDAVAAAFADNRAAGRVAKVGDTMTGNLSITKGDPQVLLHYPGVKNASLLLGSDGRLYYRDGNDGTVHFQISPNGAVWTQEFGDLNSRIENRAAAYAQSAINVANDKFQQIRLTGFGNTGGNLNFNTIGGGMVITGYNRQAGQAGDVANLYYAQLQGFSPSRGWVAAYND